MPPFTIQQAFDLAQHHHQSGRLAEAEQLYRQILAQQPDHVETIHYLGVIAHQMGRNDIAVQLIQQAIARRPNYAEACNHLGIALAAQGMHAEAIAAFRQATALRPAYAEALNNLGGGLKDAGQTDEAIVVLKKAIALRPDYADAFNNLGVAFKEQARLGESIAAHRQALALRPDYAETHSNLIYAMHYDCAYDARAIAAELERFNRQHALRFTALAQARPNINDRNPDRPLRIGYVSPDFRDHVVGRFFLPMLVYHDRRQFEVFCYANVHAPDGLTQFMQGMAQGWRSIVGVSDEAAAEVIRQDKIDILIDLAMHTAQNRLLVFARKPAPVQVTYLAYASSTGLPAIDYRLTDAHLEPPGGPQVYCEQAVHLPDVYWCYQPDPRAPDVSSLPARSTGSITFGCLNNFAKASPEAIAAWIEILRKAPSSRFLLHARPGEHRGRLLEQLRRNGVDPARLTFSDILPAADYLRQYHQIDVALDPFPYAGGTTTCDALWMGVPVITLAGKTGVGRAGVSLLASVGLNELVAQSPEQYVALALQWSADLPRLAAHRATLRQRMQRSPITDAPRFTRNIETAYRWMWRQWCEKKPGR